MPSAIRKMSGTYNSSGEGTIEDDRLWTLSEEEESKALTKTIKTEQRAEVVLPNSGGSSSSYLQRKHH